jgi:hypothetical protein
MEEFPTPEPDDPESQDCDSADSEPPDQDEEDRLAMEEFHEKEVREFVAFAESDIKSRIKSGIPSPPMPEPDDPEPEDCDFQASSEPRQKEYPMRNGQRGFLANPTRTATALSVADSLNDERFLSIHDPNIRQAYKADRAVKGVRGEAVVDLSRDAAPTAPYYSLYKRNWHKRDIPSWSADDREVYEVITNFLPLKASLEQKALCYRVVLARCRSNYKEADLLVSDLTDSHVRKILERLRKTADEIHQFRENPFPPYPLFFMRRVRAFRRGQKLLHKILQRYALDMGRRLSQVRFIFLNAKLAPWSAFLLGAPPYEEFGFTAVTGIPASIASFCLEKYDAHKRLTNDEVEHLAEYFLERAIAREQARIVSQEAPRR